MLVVRRVRAADWPHIITIYNQSVVSSVATFDVDPTSVEERVAWFGQFGDEHPLLVAESDGAIAGYAYYLPFRDRAAYAKTKELTVYVDAAKQQQGVGSALYEHLIAHAREHKVHALIGVLGGENQASAALHRKFGFELVGQLHEVGRKFDRYIDTFYYEVILSD
jgi:phosphinothricin acetyltransferase